MEHLGGFPSGVSFCLTSAKDLETFGLASGGHQLIDYSFPTEDVITCYMLLLQVISELSQHFPCLTSLCRGGNNVT